MVTLSRWVNPGIRACIALLQRSGEAFAGSKPALVVSDLPLSDAERDDVVSRVRFYAPWLEAGLQFASHYTLADTISTRTLLLRGVRSRSSDFLRRLRSQTFDIDPLLNPGEGTEWCLINLAGSSPPPREASRRRFTEYVRAIEKEGLQKVYAFGTGPSLALAANRDWSDGYRIVCNTIVRDRELWHHLQPHFIVAADAIYHFGFTEFARRFREDLRKRMSESSTLFMYPEMFHGIVARELADFADRLIPVPQGLHRDFHQSLLEVFSLPNLGNVLNLVLLPLACTLSRDVYLWGFDGRAPTDQLFWANSSKHSYPEFMDDLRAAHPSFFEHFVPTGKPTTYVAQFHGDELDRCLTEAESSGWRFTMLHKSWTATLQKRFRAP